VDEELGEGDAAAAENGGHLTKSGGEPMSIVCPTCAQETHVSNVGELPLDVVMMNAMDMADIHASRIVCTSCKTEERAVARCADCATFLCSNCVTAHKYMRCFENHKVESFEDLQKENGVHIHKPFYCSVHTMESVKFFCSTCQIPVCSECMLCVHKQPDHICDRIVDVEAKQLAELRGLIAETKDKVQQCEQASLNMDAVLTDLQQQRDSARDLIAETYQNYKAVIEKRREELLSELEKIHSGSELAIMDMYHSVEKAVEKIETACQFTERVLENGNGVEVLSMKKLITEQLMSLLNNMPRPEPTISIDFQADAKVFAATVLATFGHFRKKDDCKKDRADMRRLTLNGNNFVPPDVMTTLASMSSLAEYAPVLSSAMLSAAGSNSAIASMLAARGNCLPTSMHGLTPFIDRSGNVRGLHGMPDGIGVSGNGPMPRLPGPFNVGLHGALTMGGQPITGLNINNSAAIVRSNMPPRMHPAVSSVSDHVALAGLLNSVMLNTVAPSSNSPGSNPPMTELLGSSVPPSPLSSLPPSSVRTGNGSPMNPSAVAAMAAANLMSGPPPAGPLNGSMPPPPPPMQSYTSGEDAGIVRARSSGKITAMQIRCKFGQLGPGKGQFNSPHGFCLGIDEDIVVADTNNHRVQVFEKTGEFKYQFGIPGREEGQLWYPRKVAVIRTSGKYVVCDRGSERSRMQIFTKSGQFIKKIAIRYIDIVAGLAITSQGYIVAVDSVSPTVFCISETGDLIRWFDCSDYMREPSDIAVSGKEYFVCDFKGHCVVVFNEDGQFLHRIGCENITNYPNGIDISDAGDVLIGDSHGNRFHIAVFQRDGSLIGEFECPYVKVSRCCGLKITSEGYVVTLAKNNQHVLVLNTLYIA